jgi:chorismate mutase
LNKHLRERAKSLGLNPPHIEAVYREILTMCKYVQERNAKT